MDPLTPPITPRSPPAFEPAALADPASRKPTPRPPAGRRWKPGESGNPAGRPRRKSLPSGPAALARALKGRVTVETGGRARRLPVAEALIEAMIDRALAGDTAARRDLLKAQAELDAANAARREARRLERATKPPPKFLAGDGTLPAAQCGEHLRRALAALGAGTLHERWTAYGGAVHEANVTLDSWVVEAAFARDPGLEDRLDPRQCEAVLRAMNAGYCGMFERYGPRFAPPEVTEQTEVMARLMKRVRSEWAKTGQLFLESGRGAAGDSSKSDDVDHQ